MSFCNVVLKGNLTGDPEKRATPSGAELTSFSVAVNTRSGREDKTAFYRCTMWGKRGDVVEQYFHKGDQILVSGELSVNEFTGRDGTPRQSLEVRVDNFDFCGRRGENAGGSFAGQAADNMPGSDGVDAPAKADGTADINVEEPIDLDDIPF